jgi:exopolysaccharide biosynthesis polyprenyl glycosylphosphotransferase
VSSPSLHQGQNIPSGTEWAARLIPGADSACGRKKPQRETRRGAFQTLGRTYSFPDPGLKKGHAGGSSLWSRLRQGQGVRSFVRAMLEWVADVLRYGAVLASRCAGCEGKPSGAHAAGGMRNVLIVGAGGLGHRLANYLGEHPELGRSVCGFLDDRRPPGNGVIGRTGDLAQLARAGFVDEVILAAPHDRDLTLRVLRAARQLRLDVKMAPDLFGCGPARITEQIGDIPLISLHVERLPVLELLVKRALDVASAGLALILLAPLMALIAILIKLDSPGPVYYAALRAGRKGTPFRCYKFRTMVQDADDRKKDLRGQNQRQGPFFKITGDPRITPIGRYLRRYSLDELPQLINVLTGEMSMVGPRPHPLDDFSSYSLEHLPRLDVQPGITGLWQVTARQDPSFQTGMNLDVEYIQRWSLGMDLRILLRTAGAVLQGNGE